MHKSFGGDRYARVPAGFAAIGYVNGPELNKGGVSSPDISHREAIEASASYKAAVAAGANVQVTGRIWVAKPKGSLKDGGCAGPYRGYDAVAQVKRQFFPANREAIKESSKAAVAVGGKALKRPLVNSGLEMDEDQVRKHPRLEDPGPSFVETASATTTPGFGIKALKHPCPNSTSVTASSSDMHKSFGGDRYARVPAGFGYVNGTELNKGGVSSPDISHREAIEASASYKEAVTGSPREA